MPKRKQVKLKVTADEEESLEWFLSAIDHLTNIPSKILPSGQGGYHMFVTVVVIE